MWKLLGRRQLNKKSGGAEPMTCSFFFLMFLDVSLCFSKASAMLTSCGLNTTNSTRDPPWEDEPVTSQTDPGSLKFTLGSLQNNTHRNTSSVDTPHVQPERSVHTRMQGGGAARSQHQGKRGAWHSIMCRCLWVTSKETSDFTSEC